MAKKKAPKKSAPRKKAATGNGAQGPGPAWNFPKRTLEDALAVPRALEEKNAGKPLDSKTLCTYVGFKKPNDWRYLDTLRAANAYNLVEGSGATVDVSLTETGEAVVAPSSPVQRRRALANAFQSVELFSRVSEHYAGKRIPEDEYFANTLTREFNVERDRVDTFIEVFTKNLDYLKSFAIAPSGEEVVSPGLKKQDGQEQSQTESKELAGREFLDTCFVLMPFGGWFDQYYEGIYKPAIKDAGYEPYRADDLFHTGSVMEQIWDQVRKAKVLLAELTGKNANVFYELGLAHAIGKPVVFVTGSIDDVPFDLRHLRVIPYEVRSPGWDLRLRKDIATYLRNARNDPAKSIPQPYRDHASRLYAETAIQDADHDPPSEGE